MSEETNANPPEQVVQAITLFQDGQSNPPFPLVGLGASAGGLRALQRFFEQMPPESGMAFVVIVHLAPEHESHLPMLLQGYTAMPVVQVNETIAIKPNCVYVIPPNRNLSTIDTHLRVSPLEENRRDRAPIDHFFRTLASTHAAKAIGIVLSGTGSDGAVGLRSIQEVGGLTVAQDPADAEYNSMPQSSIATGQVELVLPADQMPAKLIEYMRSAATLPVPNEGEELPEDTRDLVQKILTQVRAYSGHDFVRYKHSTIMRRIQRRMQVHGFDKLIDYLGYLREHSEEIQALFADFLITVTNFFRDPDAFARLDREVIPAIFQDKGPDDQVRVWVVGCATGEEAYSVGMLLLEHANQLDRPPNLQIFATDLSEEALRRAREGLYPEAIVIDLPKGRLARFFVKEQGGYRVRQELRQIVLFAPHNLLKDPPFSKLDLITCRNVLIYLQRNVQQQLFELFHYSLRPNGYLFLGSAETIEGSQLFRDANRRYCIFQRQPVGPREARLPSLPLTVSALRPPPETQPSITSYEVLHLRLMEQYAPPSLVVNADYNIVYFSEGVTRYLHQPRGEPTNNLLRRVREELRVDLTTGLYRAFEAGEASQSKAILVKFNGSVRSVQLDIRPALDAGLKGFVLVLFHEYEYSEADPEGKLISPHTLNTLEEELQAVRKQLQTTIEEYETSKEEMKAANEELQSMNEELRSTAEELETSKEELQSINEELLTVNQENKNKIDELSRLTSDLQNLLTATDIATLFLDRELHIKRFTPRVAEIFNVLATDRGRPLAHITHNLVDVPLLQDAATVLHTLMPVTREAHSEAGHVYIMRVLPYRTVNDRIDGLVLTFVDMTDQTRAEEALRKNLALLSIAMDVTNAGWGNWYWRTGKAEWSESGKRIMGFATKEEANSVEGWLQRIHPEDRRRVETYATQSSAEHRDFNVEYRIIRATGEVRWLLGAGRTFYGEGDTPIHTTGLVVDITERKQTEANLRASEERFRHISESGLISIAFFRGDGVITEANAAFLSLVGYSRADLAAGAVRWEKLTPPERMAHTLQVLDQFRQSGKIVPYEQEYVRRDGSRFWALSGSARVDDSEEGVAFVIDITERKRVEDVAGE